MSTKRQIRCAIYTRKSTEEGLEQDFNSLDAQREACAAYIISQKAEGWIAVPERYDDGGYSGGTLERPALQRLLKDIERGCHRGRRRLQNRPPQPLAHGLCQAGRGVRPNGCDLRFGHTVVQHDHLHGAVDAQCAVVLRPVRARGHRRTHPRQVCRLQTQGHLDGWQSTSWI